MKARIVLGLLVALLTVSMTLAAPRTPQTITDDINPYGQQHNACYETYSKAIDNAHANLDLCLASSPYERIEGKSESVNLPVIPTPRLTHTNVITLAPNDDVPAQPGKYYAATPADGDTAITEDPSPVPGGVRVTADDSNPNAQAPTRPRYDDGFITDDPDPTDNENTPDGVQDGPDGWPTLGRSGDRRNPRNPKIVPHVESRPVVVFDWTNDSCDPDYTNHVTMDTLPDIDHLAQFFSCDVTRITATTQSDAAVPEFEIVALNLAAMDNYTWSACDDAVDCAAFLKKACADRATFLERNSFDATSATPCSGYCVNGLSITADCKKFKKTGTTTPRQPCNKCQSGPQY